MPKLSLLTLNIANPSPERAERQLGWLAARDEDVLVLTETKDSTGCRLLADAFSGAGYQVNYPKPENGDYGVTIVSRDVPRRSQRPRTRPPAALQFFAPFEYDFYRQLTDRCGLLDAFRVLHPEKIEHSWVGRTGDGYRYDHIHCTADLAATLVFCDYLHQARVDRLSDHSALSVRLATEPSQPLITSAPATVSAPPTLF